MVIGLSLTGLILWSRPSNADEKSKNSPTTFKKCFEVASKIMDDYKYNAQSGVPLSQIAKVNAQGFLDILYSNPNQKGTDLGRGDVLISKFIERELGAPDVTIDYTDNPYLYIHFTRDDQGRLTEIRVYDSTSFSEDIKFKVTTNKVNDKTEATCVVSEVKVNVNVPPNIDFNLENCSSDTPSAKCKDSKHLSDYAQEISNMNKALAKAKKEEEEKDAQSVSPVRQKSGN
jgi:hypothetical protein